MSNSMKVHGGPRAPCTQRIKVVAYEKGVELDIVICNVATKEYKSAAWLEKQPFGQIPYLDENGFILYESRAIARYLATKYADQGTRLLPDPTDLKAMALLDQSLSVETSNFDPSVSAITREGIIVP
ncbi:hypothetical protein FRB95_000835, partial [Tulasnella sp. JGI-2019a]